MAEQAEWSVETGRLISEMVEANPGGSALRVPANILIRLLRRVAARAIELDDPELNVLMLRMALYDADPTKRVAMIEAQKARKQ